MARHNLNPRWPFWLASAPPAPPPPPINVSVTVVAAGAQAVGGPATLSATVAVTATTARAGGRAFTPSATAGLGAAPPAALARGSAASPTVAIVTAVTPPSAIARASASAGLGFSALTLAASAISPGLATLNGTVNPQGTDAQAYFQWGTDATYGQQTPTVDAGSGSTPAPVSSTISGLGGGQTYHFRIVATDATGTTFGLDETFTAATQWVIPAQRTARNPFTYLAFDLTTAAPLDTLPYQGVSFGRIMNQPGAWAGALPITDPRVKLLDWSDASRTGRTALFVDYLGALIWGGIIWTRGYQKTKPVLQVGAMEFGSYFQHRLQALDYSTTFAAGTDPMVVAQTVLTDAMAVGTVMGGLTLTLNPAGGEGGNQVQSSYPGTSLQTIDSIVSTLSQMGYTFGFDYSFDVAYLPGTRTPGVTLNIWYPRMGLTADRSQIVVMVKDTLDYGYPEDATQQADSVTETGSGTGGVQPAVATASLPGYPLLERTFSRTQVIDEGTLSNIALGDLGLYGYPPVNPWVLLPVPLPDAQGNVNPGRLTFGQFNLGDDWIFRIDPVAGGGENTDPRFPGGMDFEWQMQRWTCQVVDQGVPTLRFDAGIPPINQIPPPAPPG